MSEVATIDQTPALPIEATGTDRLIEIAVQRGASIDELSQLIDLKERVESDEARKAFVKSMSKFHKDAPALPKDTPGHHNNYADLASITSKINPVLAKHGLSFNWVTEQADKITVHCDVTHEKGHSQRTSLSGPPDEGGSKNAIQAIGSTVSYLQRYTLQSALGLATGGDDDGESSSPVREALDKQQPKRSTSVAAAVIEESGGATLPPGKAEEYAQKLKTATFDVDESAVIELWGELDNNGKTEVWRKLSATDRKEIIEITDKYK